MTTLRALSLPLLLGLALPCTSLVHADAEAATVRASTVTPETAKRQLSALHDAGVRTHGALASASPKVLTRIFGRRQARTLQAAARAHTGADGLLDPSSELTAVSIIDPQFVPTPRLKQTADAERRLEAARREMRALAELRVTTYGDVLRADRRRLAATLGRARARDIVATVENLRRLVGAAEGSIAIIDPQFLEMRFDAPFVADPTMVSNIESPLLKVGANPTPHP